MAVEAHHMNIFSPQLLSNRDCVIFEQDMNHGGVPFVTGEFLAVDPLAKACFKKNQKVVSLTTSTHPLFFLSPQNVREDLNTLTQTLISRLRLSGGPIQNQQQLEIDRFVAQQTEQLRIEVEARQRTQTRMLASAVQNGIVKKLKEKDDEILRLRNLNWVLQERVKSLYVENQIWRDMAQTNEAHANNLRTNLDQVLAQVQTLPTAPTDVEDDAESSCGSCVVGGEGVTGVGSGCKRCGEREACVLVLPCRHLCLCSVCGSVLLQTCPVCDSAMNASVHVNMSS